MLNKLLKHEFTATGRFMWVIYAAMALLSVGANLSMRYMSGGHNKILNAISVLVLVAWGLSLVIGVVMTIVLLVKRFHQNLLTDEGYLMFTLPGTVHQLVLSKLIAAVVWLMVTILVVILCVFIAVLENDLLRDVMDVIRYMFQEMTARTALNGTAVIVECLAALFVGCACSCLQFYSAMSLGYGFNSHKALWSVVLYFLMQFALQVIATVLMIALGNLAPVQTTVAGMVGSMNAMQTWHLGILSTIALELVVSAVFYIITVLNLQKRLNLS